MEILKSGKMPSKWYGSCDKCGAVVSAQETELSIIPGDYRSDNEDFAWGTCPCCNTLRSVCFHKEGTKSAGRDLAKVPY